MLQGLSVLVVAGLFGYLFAQALPTLVLVVACFAVGAVIRIGIDSVRGKKS